MTKKIQDFKNSLILVNGIRIEPRFYKDEDFTNEYELPKEAQENIQMLFEKIFLFGLPPIGTFIYPDNDDSYKIFQYDYTFNYNTTPQISLVINMV